jgi:hypothetical protein
MSSIHSTEHCLTDEFTTLVQRARDQRDAEARLALFAALLDLERRAGLADVSDEFLRQITEARFLAGILRDCVVTVSPHGPWGVKRALSKPRRPGSGGERDRDVVGASQR